VKRIVQVSKIEKDFRQVAARSRICAGKIVSSTKKTQSKRRDTNMLLVTTSLVSAVAAELNQIQVIICWDF